MAYDLDSPNILSTLDAKIELQKANLRGLKTYHRGAHYTLWIGAALFTAAVLAWSSDNRTLAGWLIAYSVLAGVTFYLFAPLLKHYAASAQEELDELTALKAQAHERHG